MWCTRIVSIAFHLKSLESHKIWNLLGHIVADARMEKSQPLKQYRKPYFHFVMKRKSRSLLLPAKKCKRSSQLCQKMVSKSAPRMHRHAWHESAEASQIFNSRSELRKKLEERMPLKGSLSFLKASLGSLFTSFNRKSKFWISSKHESRKNHLSKNFIY